MTKVYVATDGTEFSTKEDVTEYHKLLKLADEQFVQARKEFLTLRDYQTKVTLAIFEFRDNCNHEYVKVKACADTGNYDRSQDEYWYEIECKCCEKRWHENQSNSKYRTSDPKVEWIK